MQPPEMVYGDPNVMMGGGPVGASARLYNAAGKGGGGGGGNGGGASRSGGAPVKSSSAPDVSEIMTTTPPLSQGNWVQVGAQQCESLLGRQCSNHQLFRKATLLNGYRCCAQFTACNGGSFLWNLCIICCLRQGMCESLCTWILSADAFCCCTVH